MGLTQPLILLAIEPKTPADREKLRVGLGKLMAEDPTIRVQTDQQSGQVILAVIWAMMTASRLLVRRVSPCRK